MNRLKVLVVLGSFAVLGLLAVAGSVNSEEKGGNADKIVGKWNMEFSEKDKAPPGAKGTVEFTKDKKLKLAMSFKIGDKEQTITADGTYEVNGDKLKTTIKFGGQEKSDTDTIKKLTDKEMVLFNEDKKEEKKFTRTK